MKTLQSKILKPFIIVLLLAQIITFLFFNVAMNMYVENSTKDELMNIIDSIEPIVAKQFVNQTGKPNQEQLTLLRHALRLSKMAMETEMFVIDNNNKIIFPMLLENSMMNEQLQNSLNTKLTEFLPNEFYKWNDNNNKYYLTFKTLKTETRPLKFVLISKNDGANEFITFVNWVNIVILITMMLIGIIVAWIVSKGIAKPVNLLSRQARNIGKGEFLSLPNNSDCVEIQALTEQFNQMSRQLKEKETAQKVFLQNASHELRTPLMSIQGYAEGIAKGIFTDVKQSAKIICDESNRLKILVEQLLTLSRIENISTDITLIETSLVSLIKDFKQRLEGYAIKEGKTIEILHPNEILNGLVNEEMLWQAVSNILINSIKYANSKILIELYDDGNFVCICISDDGEGVNPQDLPHLFERFYKGKGGNFGLGLSIAKSAIVSIGGTLKVSNDNVGAVFIILLKKPTP